MNTHDYKMAGNIKYPYGVVSPSDKTKLALGFYTESLAKDFADHMNECIEDYPYGFDTLYWPTKPQDFIVIEFDWE